MSYKLPDEKDLEAMIGIVGKKYASNNKAITASYLSKSVMGLESQIPDIVIRPKYVEEIRKTRKKLNIKAFFIKISSFFVDNYRYHIPHCFSPSWMIHKFSDHSINKIFKSQLHLPERFTSNLENIVVSV